MKHYLIRWCSVCKVPFGKTPCQPHNHGKASHGYCPKCAKKAKADMEAYYRGRLPNIRRAEPGRAEEAVLGT